MPRQFFFALLLFLVPILSAQSQPVQPAPADPARLDVPVVSKQQAYPTDGVDHLWIRVIFAGGTGFVGTVPAELRDMQALLTQAFRYPGYTLVNHIRLSLMDNEEAVAQVFPEHFLRILPKGSTSGGEGIKLKAELYRAPDEETLHTRLYLDAGPDRSSRDPQNSRSQDNSPQNTDPQNAARSPVLSVENAPAEGQHSPIFPLLSSGAVVTSDRWEAFGGIPVTVNARNEISTTPASGSTLSTLSTGTRGSQKYLILGLRLTE